MVWHLAPVRVLGPARSPRGMCLARGHSGVGPRRGYQLPVPLPEGRRVALQDHFGGRAPVGCPLRGNRRVSGWLPEAVVCFGGPPRGRRGKLAAPRCTEQQQCVCVCVRVCVCVCVHRSICVVSFRGPEFFVVVFAVGRHSCRSFSTSCQTHGGDPLRTPDTLCAFSDIAAPGPDVLLARPGSGSKLLSAYRVTEQAEVPISSRCGKLVVPLTS